MFAANDKLTKTQEHRYVKRKAKHIAPVISRVWFCQTEPNNKRNVRAHQDNPEHSHTQ